VFRVRIKRGKRFVKTPKLYSIAGPPVGFIAFKRPPRAKIKRVRSSLWRFAIRRYPTVVVVPPPVALVYRPHRFPRIKRTGIIQRLLDGPGAPGVVITPVGFVPAKRRWRVRIKRARRFVPPHRYPNMDAPAGFAPFVAERVLQLRSRPLARFFRPRRRGIFPVVVVTPSPLVFKALRRLRLKRRVVRTAPRRYPVMGAPVGFIAFKRPPRAKIKRFRIRLRPRTYPIVTTLVVMYRALRRLKIKRGRRFVAFPRRYSIAGPPTGFIAFKRPPRAKVRRWKSPLRQFAKRLYSFEGIAPPPPPIVLPPAGGGKRKRKTRAEIERERKIAAAVEQARQALSPGDRARSEIAKKLRRAVKSEGLLITEEEMFLLLHALEDDDED